MSRVLVLGMAPLPCENTLKSYAPGLRTWQFARALQADGHDVVLLCRRIPHVYAEKSPPAVSYVDPHLGVQRVDVDESALAGGRLLPAAIEVFQPDCLVGVHHYGAALAAEIDSGLPLWADLNGHLMAEAQAKAFAYRDDKYLAHFWHIEQRVLDRGDAFSVASRPQYYATLGELGTRGRLNQHTAGHRLVAVVPDTYPPPPPRSRPVAVRGRLVPDDAFVVLWSGGYNTWTDIATLFHGLEQAMARVPGLYFVSTGGQIDGHDELTYPRFLTMISESPYRERFVMQGWLPADEIPAYLAAADLAINLDAPLAEAELGTRTRVLNWAVAGVPIASTPICELARELAERELLYGFPPGDPDALAETLVAAAHDEQRLERARRAAEYVRREYSCERTAAPLVQWCRDPRPAPDRRAGQHASQWATAVTATEPVVIAQPASAPAGPGAAAPPAPPAPPTALVVAQPRSVLGRASLVVADVLGAWGRYGTRAALACGGFYLRSAARKAGRRLRGR